MGWGRGQGGAAGWGRGHGADPTDPTLTPLMTLVTTVVPMTPMTPCGHAEPALTLPLTPLTPALSPRAPRFQLHVWDVGGQSSLRSYWRNYFESTDGLVWVVDSSDRQRLRLCASELRALLREEVTPGPAWGQGDTHGTGDGLGMGAAMGGHGDLEHGGLVGGHEDMETWGHWGHGAGGCDGARGSLGGDTITAVCSAWPGPPCSCSPTNRTCPGRCRPGTSARYPRNGTPNRGHSEPGTSQTQDHP